MDDYDRFHDGSDPKHREWVAQDPEGRMVPSNPFQALSDFEEWKKTSKTKRATDYQWDDQWDDATDALQPGDPRYVDWSEDDDDARGTIDYYAKAGRKTARSEEEVRRERDEVDKQLDDVLDNGGDPKPLRQKLRDLNDELSDTMREDKYGGKTSHRTTAAGIEDADELIPEDNWDGYLKERETEDTNKVRNNFASRTAGLDWKSTGNGAEFEGFGLWAEITKESDGTYTVEFWDGAMTHDFASLDEAKREAESVINFHRTSSRRTARSENKVRNNFASREAGLGTHTGYWAKGGSGEVWVADGDYMNQTNNAKRLGTASSITEAYDLFGSAGYVRYSDLSPTPGMDGQQYSCDLRTEIHSSRKQAADWTDNGVTGYCRTCGSSGDDTGLADGRETCLNCGAAKKESSLRMASVKVATDWHAIGYSAYLAGDPAAPALNAQVMQAIGDMPVGGGGEEIMRAFTEGYERARDDEMAKEFPGMPLASVARRTAGWVQENDSDGSRVLTFVDSLKGTELYVSPRMMVGDYGQSYPDPSGEQQWEVWQGDDMVDLGFASSVDDAKNQAENVLGRIAKRTAQVDQALLEELRTYMEQNTPRDGLWDDSQWKRAVARFGREKGLDPYAAAHLGDALLFGASAKRTAGRDFELAVVRTAGDLSWTREGEDEYASEQLGMTLTVGPSGAPGTWSWEVFDDMGGGEVAAGVAPSAGEAQLAAENAYQGFSGIELAVMRTAGWYDYRAIDGDERLINEVSVGDTLHDSAFKTDSKVVKIEPHFSNSNALTFTVKKGDGSTGQIVLDW